MCVCVCLCVCSHTVYGVAKQSETPTAALPPLWELILSVQEVIGLHALGDIECLLLLLTYSSD